jgi:hypothetical protein
MRAAGTGDIQMAEILLSSGGSLSAVDDDGDGPLFYATSRAQVEMVDYLLREGADPSPKPNVQGHTPLSAAATWAIGNALPLGTTSSAFQAIAVALLRAGADPTLIYGHGFAIALQGSGGLQPIALNRLQRILAADGLRVVWIAD